jgi:predicted nucleic acid-binding protein
MKPRVYIETSVISYLTSRPSTHIMTIARQRSTSDFWEAISGGRLEGYISDLVVAEISRGDVNAAQRRIDSIQSFPQFQSGAQARELAQRLIECGAVPATEPEDALHIALATIAQVDYIASWNFVHIVGPHAKRRLLDHIRALGHNAPLLATPEEIIEELTGNDYAKPN